MILIIIILLLLYILNITICSNINSLKYLYQNNINNKLFISSLTSMSLLLDNNTYKIDDNLLIFCPGYKIPIECYNTIYNIIKNSIKNTNFETIIYNSNNIDNNDSILTDVDNLKNIILSKVNEKYKKNIIIFSHSRGSSVALSSLLLANINKDNNNNNNNNILLILLDPVDDSINNAYKILKDYHNNNDNIKILLIKLPYGGYSKFYKKSFDSSCAPIGRNADTFKILFEENKYNINYKNIKELGHFGLLEENELEKLVIGNVCQLYDDRLSLNTIQSKKDYAYNIIEEFIKINLK